MHKCYPQVGGELVKCRDGLVETATADPKFTVVLVISAEEGRVHGEHTDAQASYVNHLGGLAGRALRACTHIFEIVVMPYAERVELGEVVLQMVGTEELHRLFLGGESPSEPFTCVAVHIVVAWHNEEAVLVEPRGLEQRIEENRRMSVLLCIPTMSYVACSENEIRATALGTELCHGCNQGAQHYVTVVGVVVLEVEVRDMQPRDHPFASAVACRHGSHASY
jgi:hypothetical protein